MIKYWIFTLFTTLLLTAAVDARAHNLVTVQGKAQDHKHVYKRQEYGKPLQQGHLYQSGGGNGVIIWGSDARPEYGKSTVARNGVVIGDQKTRRGAKPASAKKFGSAVNGYGKPVRGYGKSIWDYGNSATQ